jgi:gluconolactonase
MKNLNLTLFISFCLIFSFLPKNSNCQTLTDPVVEKIAGGFSFVEGPVWVDGKGLLFSDIPENKIFLFDLDSVLTVFKTPSGNSNGLALDAEGNLILCQHGPRQVGILEESGDIKVLASHYNGKRLNSPNDLDLASDGSIFFTDPPYGLNDQGGTSELGFCGIYRLMPSGKIYLLDSTVNIPNGIAISPDETKLYSGDSEARILFIWDIVNDSTIANKQQFAYMSPAGYADGMKTDSAGYLYATGPGGVWMYKPDGTFIRIIPVPGQTSNCCWGDADRKTLYVTSGNSVYRIRNKVATSPVVGLNETNNIGHKLKTCPNPISTNTLISFNLNAESHITLNVLNATGQIMETLAQGI